MGISIIVPAQKVWEVLTPRHAARLRPHPSPRLGEVRFHWVESFEWNAFVRQHGQISDPGNGKVQAFGGRLPTRYSIVLNSASILSAKVRIWLMDFSNCRTWLAVAFFTNRLRFS